MEDFIDARHLLVTISGGARGLIDSHLDLKGLNRRVAVTVNEFVGVPSWPRPGGRKRLGIHLHGNTLW